MAKLNLLDLDYQALGNLLTSLAQPAYRAAQILKWVHQRGVTDFSLMTNLSKALQHKLAQRCDIEVPQLQLEKVASDDTHKWLLRLSGGSAIETVFIPERKRGTLCVSSQVGCALNCSFCATGKEGFSRNLSLAEIIGQLWFAVQRLRTLGDYKVTNVVMMGMGEPLLNYDAVVAAMNLMLDDNAYGLSKYRVTLSTSGVVPALQRLREDSPVALAVSLHAANDELRNQLVPLNKKYPLQTLIPICRDYYPRDAKRSVTFEYVMLKGVNDSLRDAKQLIKLVGQMRCKINLIPFNPFSGTVYQRSEDETIAVFQKTLMAAGINTRVRRTRGEDIDGACGQLAGKFKDRTGRHQRWLKTRRLIPTKAQKPIVGEHARDT